MSFIRLWTFATKAFRQTGIEAEPVSPTQLASAVPVNAERETEENSAESEPGSETEPEPEPEPEPEAAESDVTGTPLHELHLHDWQLRIRWVFKPADEIPERAEHLVLPEAEHASAKQRARVMLPSGKVLEVDASVLLHYCHALRPHANDLLEKRVLWVTYLPDPDGRHDEKVEGFFTLLHRGRLEKGHLDTCSMRPSYGAFIDAFTVEAAKARYNHIAKCVINGSSRCSQGQHGVRLFMWLDGFQLCNPDWRRDSLMLLSQLTPDWLKLWLDGDNRRRLLEAFTVEDIVTLAYSRWTGEFQQLPAPTASSSTKRPRPLGEVVLGDAKHLPASLQLKVVISDDFSIICTSYAATARIPFIREAPIDDNEPLPTVDLRFASPFPQHEVLEFFTMVDSGEKFTKHSSWKLSWVKLADYLQMADVLDKAAKWVWSEDAAAMLIDWLPVTKLHSMQQRKPAHKDVHAMLATAARTGTNDSLLAAVLKRYGAQVVERLGMDTFFDLLLVKPT